MKALALVPTLVLAAPLAHAEPEAIHDAGTMPAVDGGLELELVAGAATAIGNAGGGMTAGDLIGTGSHVELAIGGRITPHFALSFYADAQGLNTGSSKNRDVYAGTAGVLASFHYAPRRAVDPWVGIGAGVSSILVDTSDGISLAVGAELARVQLGLDVRINEDLAIGPVIGASASLYGAQRDPMHDFVELDDKGIAWTLSAGIAARFNAFGSRK